MEITDQDFQTANARAAAPGPRVSEVRYDRHDRKLQFVLKTKGPQLALLVSPRDLEGLEHATADQLMQVEISPDGRGVHFPALDADVWVPALLEGILGSASWMAARAGSKGGSSRSATKGNAARANGKLGGRPRKAPLAA